MSCRMKDLYQAPLMKLGKQIGYNTNKMQHTKRIETEIVRRKIVGLSDPILLRMILIHTSGLCILPFWDHTQVLRLLSSYT